MPVKRSFRQRMSAAATMVAIGGLVASFAIPGHAYTPQVAHAASARAAAGVSVPATAAAVDPARDEFTSTSVSDLGRRTASPSQAAAYAAYLASGALELGDDYPWPSATTYTASPLNYYYRECVDFVAWRLNRDAGTLTAPFAFTWSYLTPNGGNASEWKSAWLAHGWPTSSVPTVGSVAWWSSNHVAYVKAVNADGTVTLEEYNWGNTHVYGTRTIPASDVELFLSAPPRQ